MKQVIFILLLVGLAYLGSVQVARFLYGRYRSTVRLYRDLQLFFRERGKGKVVVTIRIPKRELSQEENILLAELPIKEEQQQEQSFETEMLEETFQVFSKRKRYLYWWKSKVKTTLFQKASPWKSCNKWAMSSPVRMPR